MAHWKSILLALLCISSRLKRNVHCCSTQYLSETIDITNGIKANSSIIYENITYAVGTYFYHNHQIRGCICKIKICLNKCCPRGRVFINVKCENYDGNLITNFDVYRGTKKSHLTANDFYFITMGGHNGTKQPLTFQKHQYYIQENGEIYMAKENLTDKRSYCIDSTSDSRVLVFRIIQNKEKILNTCSAGTNKFIIL